MPVIKKPVKGSPQALIHKKRIEKTINTIGRRKFFNELKRNRLKDTATRKTLNTWINNRKFKKYRTVFEPGLKLMGIGQNIIDAFARIPRKNNRKLIVLEDGAGEGNALVNLKKLLTRTGIPSKTIGLSLGANPELIKKKQAGLIDELVIKPGELFVPKKPVDVIISNFGSIEYAWRGLRKDHILKLAYSLRKGGIMLIGINLGVYGKSIKGIETAFVKRGFNAKFFITPEKASMQYPTLPPFTFVIQRTSKPYSKPNKRK